ncbi:MAG: mucin-desulfating sulfatase, partial [Oscillospiraceae bacterium]
YLEAAGKILTEKEKDYLPWGAKMMTLECGMRFLTDYLQGDTYFKASCPLHNLYRCRTQFRLVDEMEQNWQKMNDIVAKYR